jgi:glycosyltransferase involved in cell wall biosynthesis
MKVMIITDAWHPQVNGVVRTYEFLGTEMIKRGHDIRIISPADFPLQIPMPGYKEIKLALFAYKKLCALINNYGPDVIHIATEGPLGWAARKYCMRRSIPFSTSYHTHFPDYIAKRVGKIMPSLYDTAHKFTRKLVYTFHNPATCMMITTQSVEDDLKKWGVTAPMHRLSRGVNLSQFYPGEATEFKDLPRPIALYVGRVAIEKNLEDYLSMEWDGSKIVVGDGPSKTMLERKYPDARFTGLKQGEDLAAIYRSADVFVFPSRTDTFGIVLIEALASGLPIAAYNVTGPKDIVTESFLGVLCEKDLAEASKKALTLGQFEQRAQHAKENYTWNAAANQFENALLLTVKK